MSNDKTNILQKNYLLFSDILHNSTSQIVPYQDKLKYERQALLVLLYNENISLMHGKMTLLPDNRFEIPAQILKNSAETADRAFAVLILFLLKIT